MNAEHRVPFAEAMGVLAETFNEPISATKVEAYFSALSDLPFDDVARAARKVLQEARFFPKPVELREAVRGSAAERADDRWGLVMEAVRRVGYNGHPTFDDPLILQVVERLWGTWEALCRSLPAGGPELVGWIKQFKAVYVTLATREHQDLRTPMLSEATRAVIHQVEDIAKRKVMPAPETVQEDLDGRPMWAGALLVGGHGYHEDTDA
jgi:hypothetical protein